MHDCGGQNTAWDILQTGASTFCLRQDRSLDWNFAKKVKLAGQRAPGVHLSLPPILHVMPRLLCGFWGSHSGEHVPG